MRELHKSKAFLWTLLILFLLVWFYMLGARTLVPTDEGRYAEMAREMVATQDWITTRLNGIKYFENRRCNLDERDHVRTVRPRRMAGASVDRFVRFARHRSGGIRRTPGIQRTYRVLRTAGAGIQLFLGRHGSHQHARHGTGRHDDHQPVRPVAGAAQWTPAAANSATGCWPAGPAWRWRCCPRV